MQNSQVKLHKSNVNVSFNPPGLPPVTAADKNQTSPTYEPHVPSQFPPNRSSNDSKFNFRLNWNANVGQHLDD